MTLSLDLGGAAAVAADREVPTLDASDVAPRLLARDHTLWGQAAESEVKAIAARLHETLPVHIDVEDLTHAGIFGLMDAASRYDSSM